MGRTKAMSKPVPVELIARYLSNEANAKEQELLLEWVGSSAEHQKIFQQYAAAWNKAESVYQTTNEDHALKYLNARIDRLETQSLNKEVALRVPWLKVAASLLLLIVVGLGVYSFYRSSNAIRYSEVITGHAQRTTVVLADGSKVKLNSNSRLRYPEKFLDNHRDVTLTGEAFFDVFRDETRPFIVQAGNVSTEVLGTSFNVVTDSLSVEVIVATGKVKVSDGHTSELLRPGDKVTHQNAVKGFNRQRVDLDRELAWLSNTIIFEDTSLASAMSVLEAWFGVSIIIRNPAITKCKISGTYKNESLAHILDAIKFSTGVEITGKDGSILIDGKGCENQ